MRFFMHTPKAVRRQGALTGCMPADRLFVVHNDFKDGRRTWYNAWKAQITSSGLKHPAFKEILPINEVTLAKLEKVPDQAKNGAEPTAQFYKDSFYREVTWDEVRAISEAGLGAKPPVTQRATVVETKTESTLTYTVELALPTDPVKLAAIRRLMKKLHENLEAL
jgi:hypothetical protein